VLSCDNCGKHYSAKLERCPRCLAGRAHSSPVLEPNGPTALAATSYGDLPYASRPAVVRLLSAGWGIIWRMSLWGIGAGAGAGLLYGCSAALFFGALYGMVSGALMGLTEGLVSGVVMAIFTLQAVPRIRSERRYIAIMQFLPVVVILALGAILLVSTVAADWSFYYNPGGVPEFAEREWNRLLNDRWQVSTIYLPGLISLFPAWFAARQVARWVVDYYGSEFTRLETA
jgi:hypothetical protein